jgi:hypothetical protein
MARMTEKLDGCDIVTREEVQYVTSRRDSPDGDFIYIHDAESGKKGYYCSDCKSEMIAYKGEKKRAYFGHVSGSMCSGGEGPAHEYTKLRIRDFLKDIDYEGMKFQNVCVENTINVGDKQYRIDTYAELWGHRLYIEVVDSHGVSDEKRKALGNNLIEIHITEKSWGEIVDSGSAMIQTYHQIMTKMIELQADGEIEKQLSLYQKKIEEEDRIQSVRKKIGDIDSSRPKTIEEPESKELFNEGTSNDGVPSFTHEMKCWKCEKNILVYSGSPPDEWGQVTAHDIIRMGVCYTHRYVKSRMTSDWMNVCPYCNQSQMGKKVRKLR